MMNFNMNPPTTNTAKYKTMLCKHFETSKGCAFKDKCQFAHGYGELRTATGFTGTQTPMSTTKPSSQTSTEKKGPNLQNYKIVKCKYWEKDGTCRYGTLCTFAHGDTEMRTKTDNLLLNQGQMGFYDPGMQMMPGMMPPMQGGQMDPNFAMMNPYMMGFDPNLMMGGMGMGMPQGFDPMTGMGAYQGYPGDKDNTSSTNGNTNI